jgi:hypothetical protein
MAGKLSPNAQQQIALLESFTSDIGRINGLVEQYAAAKVGQDQLKASLKRAASRTKMKLMSTGLDQLSHLCGSIELAVSRPGPPAQQVRTLRELVGSLKFQLDLAARTIVREEQEAHARKQHDAEVD